MIRWCSLAKPGVVQICHVSLSRGVCRFAPEKELVHQLDSAKSTGPVLKCKPDKQGVASYSRLAFLTLAGIYVRIVSAG